MVLQTANTLAAVNDEVAVGALADQSTFTCALNGTLKGTVVVEGTIGGTVWGPVSFAPYQDPGNANLTMNVTGNEMLIARIPGLTFVRLRVTAYTSGSASAVARATDGIPSVV